MNTFQKTLSKTHLADPRKDLLVCIVKQEELSFLLKKLALTPHGPPKASRALGAWLSQANHTEAAETWSSGLCLDPQEQKLCHAYL